MYDFEDARRRMVSGQIRVHDVTDKRIQDAMVRLPRERFVPRSQHAHAYADMEIAGGEGRTLMRPRDFAKLIQAADLRSRDIVLDIACARGYSTAVLADICETVVGLEDNDEAIERATARLSEVGADNAVVVRGELKDGVPDQGPFDVIVVNGAVEVVPDAWFDQLAEGGRLAVVVREGPVGRATIFWRAGGKIDEWEAFDATQPVLPGFEREAGFVF